MKFHHIHIWKSIMKALYCTFDTFCCVFAETLLCCTIWSPSWRRNIPKSWSSRRTCRVSQRQPKSSKGREQWFPSVFLIFVCKICHQLWFNCWHIKRVSVKGESSAWGTSFSATSFLSEWWWPFFLPRSMTELEKDIGNLRSGLKSVESVSHGYLFANSAELFFMFSF